MNESFSKDFLKEESVFILHKRGSAACVPAALNSNTEKEHGIGRFHIKNYAPRSESSVCIFGTYVQYYT